MSFTDKKLIRTRYSGFVKKLSSTFYDFSLFERILVFIFSAALIVASFSLVLKLNQQFLITIPKDGGELREGMIGTSRFINPVLATSDTDRDITALIYSGLLRLNSKGELIPDLAESYSISEDGLTYYFKIRENAVFHDGTPVTSEDVIFTILKTQDPAVKSPKRPNWDGVHVEKINEREIEFTLASPYSPFIYNATLGILPKHKWQDITAEAFPFSSLNTNPIGSGPYELRAAKKDQDELIISYELKSFSKYTIKKPFISKIFITFYKTETELIEAFNKRQITSLHSISPNNISKLSMKHENLVSLPYSRIFALFFNQNKSALLTDKNLRSVLDTSIDRQALVDSVLSGHGTPLYSPLTLFSSSTPDRKYGVEEAKSQLTLLENKYDVNSDSASSTDKQKIKFTISTSNVPELVSVGEQIVGTFNSLGAQVDLKILDTNDLTSSVIRPREFEAILFGNVINRDLDYYAFWHSSQRNDPGLNLASYASIESDKALEEARNSIDIEEKLPLLQKFEKEVINDVPAVFLYSPDFIYIVPQIVQAQFPQIIVTPSDRYFEVYNWYIETETVWKIFAR